MSAISVGDVLIGQFRIDRELGYGAFGRTYLAYDLRLDDTVVVKELLEKWVAMRDICQRFVNEAQAMRRLKHPNVVTVYTLITPDSLPGLKQLYIVMEYMAGGSLEARMRKGLTWEEAVKITIEVCRGLGRAHRENIVHRDIKPANILLNPDLSSVKISDFGIAHLPDRQLTSTGGMHPGTLLYMAPESFRRLPGQLLTGRADLYALGVTLYQLVTGKEYLSFDKCWHNAEKDVRRKFHLDPDVEPTMEQQLHWQLLAQKYWVDTVCTVMPPDPREHNPEIPADLAKVIMRSLAKDPDDRYPTAEEMIDDLREAQLGKAKEISTPVVSETGWQVNEIIARSMDAARQQQLSTALELIHHAISLAPHSVRAHAALANIQMVCGDFPGACQAWHKVLELDPAYPELYVKLGQCYNRMEQHDKAIEIQKQGLRKPENRRSAALFYGLANSYYQAGRLDEAIWALEQSLQIRPDNRLKILLDRWKAEQSRT